MRALWLEPPLSCSYLPVDYGLTCEIIDDMAESRASALKQDVNIVCLVGPCGGVLRSPQRYYSQ